MQFYREERENIFTDDRGRRTNKKESSLLHISHHALAFTPRISNTKMAFALQINAAAATKKKTAGPKKATVKKVRAGLFRAGLFSTGFRFFFIVSLCRAPPKILVERKRREKNATKNDFGATKKRKTQPHRASRIRPKTALSTPSNARIERRNMPRVHRCAL